MTNEEAIKTIEIAIASECPYSDDYTNCKTRIVKDTLDLIQREIENLKVENQSLRSAANSLKMHYEEAQAEIERLNKVIRQNQQLINALNKSYFLAKAEAYKEFAERLKENINKRFVEDNTMIYRCVHIKDIDNLLKELVGENDETTII